MMWNCPPTRILVAVDFGDPALVVGTHGRRGPSRWWLGSVAERVARAAAAPVLIVHDDAPAGDVFVRPAVLDTGAGPSGALHCARQLATSAGGDVQVVPAADAAATVPALGATAVVMPRAPGGATHALPAAGPALIRDCRLPILIIPEEQS